MTIMNKESKNFDTWADLLTKSEWDSLKRYPQCLFRFTSIIYIYVT